MEKEEKKKDLEKTDTFEKFQAVQDKKKNHIGLIFFLILIILGLVGYICYDKGVFDSLLGKDKTVDPKQEEKLSDDEVMKLHDSLMIDDGDLYLKEDVNIETISSADLISYVLIEYSKKNDINFDNQSNVIDCGSTSMEEYNDNKIHLCKYDDSKEEFVSVSKDSVVSISKSDIDDEIKLLFNTNRNIELSDHTEYYGNQTVPVFVYSKDDNRFYLVNRGQVGDLGVYNANNKFLRFEQEGKNVYIYDKVVRCMSEVCYKTTAFGEDADIVIGAADRYNNGTLVDKKIIKDSSQNSLEIDFDYVFEKYSNSFNTYKTTFKKGTDGKYYWYSSEIVNE